MTKFEKSNSVEFSKGKKSKFNITISNNSDLIQFKIEDLVSSTEDEYYFEADFEDLKKLNRFFLLFLNLDEVNTNMVKLIKRDEANVKIEGKLCKLKIINALNNNEFEISLKKKKNENEKDDKEENEPNYVDIKDTTPIIKDLKDRLDELEEKSTENGKKLQKLEKIVETINKKFENGVAPSDDLIDYGKKMFESNIIDIKEEKLIYNWIKTKIISTELIFDTHKDGDSAAAFKKKCEGVCPTLTIVKTETGIVFGGYLTCPFREKIQYDNNAFTFSLNPSKMYKITEPKYAACGSNEKDRILFQFGCPYFRIEEGCTKNSNSCVVGRSYEKGLSNIIPINQKFKVSRIEVFKLNF